MDEPDIFDALREDDPAVGIDPQEAARLKTRVRARVLAHAVPRRPFRRRVLVAVAVAVLALGVAAAWYLTRQPTNPAGIGCAEDLSLDAVHVVTPIGGLDPHQCAPLWADGTITNPDIAPPGQVPPLVGCVNDTGTLIVLPTDDQRVCGRLGMANYIPPAGDTVSILEVQNRLAGHINPKTCPTFEDAQHLAQQALEDVGIDDWTVTIAQPPTDQRPCPTLAIDHTTRQIILVPAPHTSP